jgi:rod shape determining protein RodA
MFKRELWKHFDFWLFGAVVFLSLFGILMIRSAIAGNTELAGLVKRQAIYFGAGLVILVVAALIDYRYWQNFSKLFYTVTLLLLAVILIAGKVSFGAQRWLEVGLVNIQPGEIAKIVIILVLADYFSKNAKREKNVRWVLLSFLIVGGIVLQILLQPNLSTSILLFVIWFAMLWINGLPTKYLVILGVSAVVLFVAAFPFLQDYQQQRILSFIQPDPTARHGNTYNVEQALITIGNGGWLGKGYGHGTQVQLRFLKVRHNDFIFSAMAEEFGFVGTVAIVAILVFVIYRCFRSVKLASDNYGAMIAFGFATLIFFQTAVNIGVNMRLIPVTGQTLPFISYGGSSLLSLLLGVGLIESVLMHQQK